MAAQAAIHASVKSFDVIESAPNLKRVVGARLRGHDVLGVASAVIRSTFHSSWRCRPATTQLSARTHLRVLDPGFRRDDVSLRRSGVQLGHSVEPEFEVGAQLSNALTRIFAPPRLTSGDRFRDCDFAAQARHLRFGSRKTHRKRHAPSGIEIHLHLNLHQLQPLVPPHVSHLRQVPLRTSVKFPHSRQCSPS